MSSQRRGERLTLAFPRIPPGTQRNFIIRRKKRRRILQPQQVFARTLEGHASSRPSRSLAAILTSLAASRASTPPAVGRMDVGAAGLSPRRSPLPVMTFSPLPVMTFSSPRARLMTYGSRRLCRLNCKSTAFMKHRGVITVAAGLGFYVKCHMAPGTHLGAEWHCFDKLRRVCERG